MPIYEYECIECGQHHEALQKMSDAPLTQCPACGQEKLKKLVSAASFRLKGGGWYETDFKTGNKRQIADSGGDAKSKGSDKGDSGKSESGKSESGKSDAGKTAAAKPAKTASTSSKSAE